MPLMISRIGPSAGLPVAPGLGKCGAITRVGHRSVWYRATMRLCCRRIAVVHLAKPSWVKNPLESRRAPVTQPFFKNCLLQDLGIEIGHRRLASPDRLRPICGDVPRE